MDELKVWYESKVVWANLLGIIVSLAAAAQLISPEQGKIIISEVPEFLAAAATLVTSALGLYGRLVASKRIGTPVVPATPAVTAPATPTAPAVPATPAG